jgi:hypothetical protein
MKILLVRLSSFGDVVFTLPLAKALRGEGDRLAWAVEGPLAELVEGAPYVDEVLVATTRSWRKRPFAPGTRAELRTFLGALRDFGPDVAVDAQGLLKSAWVTLAARAPRKVGFGPRTVTERVNLLVTRERVDVPPGTHVVDRGLALAAQVLGRGRLPEDARRRGTSSPGRPGKWTPGSRPAPPGPSPSSSRSRPGRPRSGTRARRRPSAARSPTGGSNRSCAGGRASGTARPGSQRSRGGRLSRAAEPARGVRPARLPRRALRRSRHRTHAPRGGGRDPDGGALRADRPGAVRPRGAEGPDLA